jgi:hypothetical protein
MTAKLYSYVVDHDHGYAPNPYNGICTLVHCKFRNSSGRRNIVALANVGDWVLGSGGSSSESSGNGTILYLMRIDEKLPFDEFIADPRFTGREDHADWGHGNQFALVSRHFFYFGKNAISVHELPKTIPITRLTKKGPGFRKDLPEQALLKIIQWFEKTFEIGMHGEPCTAGGDKIKIRRKHKICGRRRGLTDWSSGRQRLSAVGSLRALRCGAAYRGR